MAHRWLAAIGPLLLIACGAAPPAFDPPERPALDPPRAEAPAAFTAPTPAAPAVLIRDVTLLTANSAQPRIERGWLRLRGGLIESLGEGDAPEAVAGEAVVDGAGLFATPGLIDTHSHLGVYATPRVWAHADGNEATAPITAGLQAEDAVWPQDPGFQRAVAGGVTTLQVLPGSANLMGGQSVVLKLHPRREVRAMRFPGAPTGVKMACGENPKRVYGKGRKAMPASRMGSLFLMRERLIEARRYKLAWDQWRHDQAHGDGKPPADPPKRDLVLDTLTDVLAGRSLVHIHCYRADEMLQQLKLAAEFGYKVRSFHHAVEAYKIRDVLAREGVSVSTWADWWGFKLEAWDAIEQTLALLAEAGVRGILHTDSAEGIQRMNQEAAKAWYAGQHAGVAVPEHVALGWITAQPAWALGILNKTGTLEVGKMADVVLWDAHPFSVYASAQQVYIDGHLRHDRAHPGEAWSDFEVTGVAAPAGTP